MKGEREERETAKGKGEMWSKGKVKTFCLFYFFVLTLFCGRRC